MALLAAATLLTAVHGQTNWTPPRTPWGAPDLQGLWNYNTLTSLERPRALEGRAFLTDEEAEAALQAAAKRATQDQPRQDYNPFWSERNAITHIAPDKPTSLIVDPANGKLPPLSHHMNEPAKLERLHKINAFHMQQFAHLVEKLHNTPEGDGTLLDRMLLVYGAGISDSNTHFHDDLPIALVGGLAAARKGGRHIRYPQGTPLANLWVTALNLLGIPRDQFGDSSGTLVT